MPILDLQRSLREIGRLRAGQKNEKGFPTKLDRFRFTSSDRTVIDAAADLYGGTVNQWTDAPIGEQWEVVTDATALEVIVPPGPAALSQWYELWSGGGCDRRCDGINEVITDQPCICDPENRECKATTRLSVILADLPGLGVWRLESKGYYAATELAGTVDVCQQYAGRGQLLAATLGLEQRQVKRRDEHGKTVTRNFVVPTLTTKATPAALGAATWSPVGPSNGPALPAAPRANAAEPITPTGLRPRPAAIQEVEINEGRIAEQTELVPSDEAPSLAALEARYGTKARALTEARRLAKTKGIDQPTTFEQIGADLVAEILR